MTEAERKGLTTGIIITTGHVIPSVGRNLFVVVTSSREIPRLRPRNDIVDRYRETTGTVIPTDREESVRRRHFPARDSLPSAAE